MQIFDHPSSVKFSSARVVTGIALILTGGILFLDRYLKSGWLSLAILPAIGLFLYLWGIKHRQVGLIIAGSLLSGIGAGCITAWGPVIQTDGSAVALGIINPPHSLAVQIGLLLFFTGISWVVITLTTVAVTPIATWWALIPGGVLGGLGACLLFTPMRWTDFVLYLALGTGLPLLFWGLVSRLFGLVIPGCLLSATGAGLYVAWQTPVIGNTLVQTGVMLIWFALGWVLITVGGRVVMQKYLWWPLIPGGIMAVVGMGLYIGGDPKRAFGFIGNTGSISLMIFGLYLLLMRKGIHH